MGPLQTASIPYLKDDPLYQTQKAYAIAFTMEGISSEEHTNHKIDERQVTVHDLRTHALMPRLESTGFQFVNSQLAHTVEDLEVRDYVQKRYFPDIAQLVMATFPQYAKVVYSDHVLRKRSPHYPLKTGFKAEFAQPLTLPHVDYTPTSTQTRLSQVLNDEEYAQLRDAPYDQLNVWRVLAGPNDDWPLALCDFASVHAVKDPLDSDLVFRDAVSENVVLRHNADHAWYYLSGQRTDEVLIFRNATSPGRTASRAFHASFDTQHRHTSETDLRQSIEVRLFAFLGETT